MKKLMDNARWFSRRARVREWAIGSQISGQHPAALFISCSDSRIVPALITEAAPGDLFELRTAGNVVPPYLSHSDTSVAATIQYAVSVLQVEHIVVCGHSYCAAVGYAIRGEDVSHLPKVQELLQLLGPLTASRTIEDLSDPGHTRTGQQHVLTQLDRLRQYPEVGQRIEAGALTLHGWFYNLPDATIRAWRNEAFTAL